MKKKRILYCMIFSLFIFLFGSSSAYAMEEEDTDEENLAPYIIILSGDPSVDRFPLKETSVTTDIDGIIAETYVVQTYANEGESPINASYVFPASDNVTIHGMRMIIGDNIVTAKIKEKEEAKEDFEEAKSEGKSASLLEQQRPNVFTMDIANIMPGDNVRIELHYTELVEPEENIYQFVFPTVVGPRYASPQREESGENAADKAGEDRSDRSAENTSGNTGEEDGWVETPYLSEGNIPPGKYDITVNLSAGVPIADIRSTSHDIHVTKNSDGSAKITLASSGKNNSESKSSENKGSKNNNPNDYAGNRDFILEYQLTGEKLDCGLMLNKGEEENYFMLMVQPPERCEIEDIPPREYMFVLDVSGSMCGFPLDTAKDLIKNLVSNLRETDSFNLMMFSDEAFLMSSTSVAANEKNINTAIRLIDEQQGGGGTELAPALEAALSFLGDQNEARSVVVITDGYISGEREIFNIIDDNLDKVSFFSFGIGTSVNRYLIDGIAKAGIGESFVVTDSSEASETAERFRTYIESPILTDIQVTYDGFDVYDVEPKKLPTLFAQRPIVVYGKWRGDLTGTVKITGNNGNGKFVKEIPVDQIKPLKDNDAIRYLWARKKIERLTDYGINENDPDIKNEVTQIGLKYSMMTPYTSFIAVVDTIRNPEKESRDVNQPLPLPLQVSDLALGGYRIGSEPGGPVLVLAVVLTFTLTYFIRRKKERGRQI